MAYTQSDLITAALRDLRSLDIAASPSTEDTAAVTARLAGFVGDLQARRIYAVASLAAIAVEAFPDLVRCLVEHCAPMYGRAADDKARAAAEARLAAIARLDTTATSGLALDVLETLDAWGAGTPTVDAAKVARDIPRYLAELAGRNVIYFATAADVTDAAMPALARYIAAALAPKPLLDVMDAAANDLQRLARMGERPARLRIDSALRPRRRHF